MYSTVLIAPIALLAQAQAVAVAMGWGEGNYSVPLTDNGTSITHYGLRVDQDEAFRLAWLDGPNGNMPEPLLSNGFPLQDYIDVTTGVIASFNVEQEGHFWSVVSENNLAPFEEVP